MSMSVARPAARISGFDEIFFLYVKSGAGLGRPDERELGLFRREIYISANGIALVFGDSDAPCIKLRRRSARGRG
jgi:hypothetical protein